MQLLAKITPYRPLVLPILLLIFTTTYLQDALSTGMLFRYGLPGASFMPVVLSVIMYVGVATIILREIAAIRRSSCTEIQSGSNGIHLAPLCIAGATLGLVLFLKILGFLMAGTLYVFVLLSIFRVQDSRSLRGLAIRAAISVIITGLVYLFFRTLFSVRLPEGVFI